MRAFWILGIVVATGLSANAENCAVTIYVSTDLPLPFGMLALAELRASAIFHDIGVSVHWRSTAAAAGAARDACGEPLAVRIEESAQANASAEALAYAAPFAESGTCIHVLLDRVMKSGPASYTPVILAYVLAHEITHVLERTGTHSSEGVMKAHWDRSDYWHMEGGGLAFSAEDVEMIHSGIAYRMQRAGRSETALNRGALPKRLANHE